MSFLVKLGDYAFMAIAYPIVMFYLYMHSDGSSLRVTESGERIRRHEKAAKTAMKERKKHEPKILRTSSSEISTITPQALIDNSGLSLFQRRIPQQPQAEPSLLLLLPLEIREQIYSNVLGDSTMHITQLPGRLGHKRCKSSQKFCTHDHIMCTRECFHPDNIIQTYRHGEFLDHNATSEDSLSLLRTCRQVYHESSRILYETNIFDFNHAQTINFFARSIRPARLSSIRHLNLTWSGTLPFLENDPSKAPDDLRTWEQTWDIIGKQMVSLRTLKVRLLIYEDDGEKTRAGPFLHYARKKWTSNSTQFEKLLENMKSNVSGLRDFRLGVELPEEIKWDVGELETSCRTIVCALKINHV